LFKGTPRAVPDNAKKITKCCIMEMVDDDEGYLILMR
jgi:hypothetical protein